MNQTICPFLKLISIQNSTETNWKIDQFFKFQNVKVFSKFNYSEALYNLETV